MRRRNQALALALATFGALAAPARADVVINRDSSRYLFWVEGERVYRGACPAGTELFDRDTCGGVEVWSATATLAYATYRAGLGPNLAADQKSQSQVWQAIQAIDAKIFELLSSEPAGTPKVTKEQIDAAEHAYDEAAAAAQSLRDQVARLLQALKETPDDGELLAQLGVTRSALSPRQTAENAALKALDQLRQAYAAERGNSDAAAFAELKRLRAAREATLTALRANLDRDLADLAGGEALLVKLADKTFAWPYDIDPYLLAQRFFHDYRDAELESRSLHVRAADRYRITFHLDDTRVIDDISCRITSQASHGFAFVFQKMSGNQILKSADLKWDFNMGGLITEDFGSITYARDELTAKGFLKVASPGDWDISFHHLSAPTGALPNPFEPLNCALVFAR